MMRIYTSKKCHYCDDLKTKLKNNNLEYKEINVDAEENSEEVKQVFDFAGEEIIPIIIKDKDMLVPSRSFQTIDQAIELIKSLK